MGSLAWMAPEVLVSPKQFTKKSDVYSYGICLWEMFTGGHNPYPSDVSHVVLANQIITEQWRPSIPFKCPAQWTDLIKKCWAQIPNDRPDFHDIIGILQGWSSLVPLLFVQRGNASEFFGNSLSSDNASEEELSELPMVPFIEEDNSNTSFMNASYDDNI